ncbi:response regulator [Shewanella holmiensis]|uniref:Response regulator n=1 Tax=Shewanella holmiensis TaxID=2952222 RepID=A0A9X2WNL6_9GAMM|nr:response regulator [Shewanella holmiensis]MCT7942741.1 response regulator [Shewanella holmiensis]
MLTPKEANCLKAILVGSINQQRALITKSSNLDATEELETKLITRVSAHNKIKVILNKFQNTPQSVTMPRVLVVDDAESMIGITCPILSEMGFRKVDSANSAEKALTKLIEAADEESPFHLVLTDWEMEDESGLDLLKNIRIHEKLLETDVFIVSSHGEQAIILKAIQAGVTGYMLKPINYNVLAKKLSGYLPEQDDAADKNNDITPKISASGQAVVPSKSK